MGQTKKRNYDRYTLEYKLQAVKLANNPNVMAKDIAWSCSCQVSKASEKDLQDQQCEY